MTGAAAPTYPIHVLISGASGLIGSAVTASLLAEGHRITRLVRRSAGAGEVSWNPEAGRLDFAGLEGVDAVIHLAGENVGHRWTRRRKARIKRSRVEGTRLLSQTIARLEKAPMVMISASAVGIYGYRGDEVLTEASALPESGRDFLATVAQEWEAAAEPARAAGIRVVHPRFGVVLSSKGGALGRMLLPFRLGLGGRIGSGSQWMSWISIDDVVGIIRYALRHQELQGPVNATAPEPVTNVRFVRALGRVLRRPTPFPVPATALRLVLGEMADSTLLTSVRALPTKLLSSGYRFQQQDLELALRHVLGVRH